MSSRKPEETANLILDALARTGQRGIIHAGWGGLQRADLPDSVLMVDGVPFSWLFPRVAAVVHHGGAGTTSAGLRAGVPSVVVPFFGDQPYWGQRVADLGVGPGADPAQEADGRAAGAGDSNRGDGSSDAPARGRAGGENPSGGWGRERRRRRGADGTLMPRINAD